MWNIWKEELYKIASRKIIWLSVFLFLAFITFRLFTERDHYSVTIDGQIFRGQEAIRKDRELTSHYAGILTQDKVRQIYEEYGFYYLDETTDSARGNFCSRFVTETFTDYMQTDGNDPTVIHFYKVRITQIIPPHIWKIKYILIISMVGMILQRSTRRPCWQHSSY